MANNAKSNSGLILADECVRSGAAFDGWYAAAEVSVWVEHRAAAARAFDALWRQSRGLTASIEEVVARDPRALSFYRAMTVMRLSREVLSNRAGVSKSVVTAMEVSGRGRSAMARAAVPKLAATLGSCLDASIVPWVRSGGEASIPQMALARSVLVDRVALATAETAMRSLHEPRQRVVVAAALRAMGYREVSSQSSLTPGTYCTGIAVALPAVGRRRPKSVQVDLLVAPTDGSDHVFVELKSAGDETNTNKRRKEDVERATSVRRVRGNGTRYVMVLGGHFGVRYLEHIHTEGIEWVWEHNAAAGLAIALVA